MSENSQSIEQSMDELWRLIRDDQQKYGHIYREVYRNCIFTREFGLEHVHITNDDGEEILYGSTLDEAVSDYVESLNAEFIRRKAEFDNQQGEISKKGNKIVRREKVKLFKSVSKSNPFQLELFTQSKKNSSEYSQTIELYDFIPKYVWGKVERVKDKFLEPIKREFVCRNIKYKLVISPAFIEEADGFKAYFPGKREELVEDALRKLMTEDSALYLEKEASIAFTLYQLQKELAAHKHTYDYTQLKEALEILAKTNIEVESEDKSAKLIFSPIEMLGLSGQNGETQTYVKFSNLLTRSINEGTYRLFNYEKVMSYNSVIARQLHKRMAHHYVQASFTEKYEILLSTIIRDFGLTKQKRIQQNLQKVEAAIEELKNKELVLNCNVEKIYDYEKKQKLEDVKFIFQPHPSFVNDTKKANAVSKQTREAIKTAYLE
jgi:hypothetical protein